MKSLLHVLILASALAAIPFVGFSQTANSPSGQKGINTNELYDLDSLQLGARISAYKRLGVGWARFDFDWSIIQPTDSKTFNVAGFDRAVRALSKAHIQVLGIMDYAPPWASGGQPTKFYPPRDPAAFANYAARLAAHFAPMGVHSWEIWNEPNLAQFWRPAPDPIRYCALLKAAFRAIHKVDGHATVLIGGLAQPSPGPFTIEAVEFLQKLYAAGAKGFFDAVADHPYISPQLPADPGPNGWQRMFATSPSLRSVMAEHGDSKTIWITEFGAPTSGRDATVVSEPRQAEMISQALTLARSYSWAGPLFVYDLRDFRVYGKTTDPQSYYGLLRYDGSAKPSFAAYESAR